MTTPTDPRVEAAARVIQIAMDGVNTAFFEYVSADALKAADKASWRPIESAPKDGETAFDIWVISKEGGYRISNVMRGNGIWVFDLMEWPDEMVPATHWMPIPSPPEATP